MKERMSKVIKDAGTEQGFLRFDGFELLEASGIPYSGNIAIPCLKLSLLGLISVEGKLTG